MFYRNRDYRHQRMIYTQAFRNEKYSPAVALFSAAGLIRTTAGLNEARKPSSNAARKKSSRPGMPSHLFYDRKGMRHSHNAC
ncbi:hypothetical protein QR680_001825 [Steinernema hermaphroditum]|uniref:Uncharacterized protein n=1 Tax=Steinernema hermaphroditum TaxID=289476 RepID=A0AA39H026_9BILA|nr:hypothetical protein QR680_001825 [Steinernema hermaphroditum]